MEMRRSIHDAMTQTFDEFAVVEDDFQEIFGRRHGAVEAIACEDAEIILVTSGTITSTARQVIEDLRSRGESVGILKVKLFRPFPVALIRQHLSRAKKVAVIDRNFSFGASGIFAQEVRAALCALPERPPVFGYVAGLGGRDVETGAIEEIYRHAKSHSSPDEESIWIGLHEVDHEAGNR
jgi:pyruvate ferredoxin oxidoreductase alpha subunit